MTEMIDRYVLIGAALFVLLPNIKLTIQLIITAIYTRNNKVIYLSDLEKK